MDSGVAQRGPRLGEGEVIGVGSGLCGESVRLRGSWLMGMVLGQLGDW
ncbi:MAG: hypothetical protein RI897_3102 [Verrucomicrobiota bacterium]